MPHSRSGPTDPPGPTDPGTSRTRAAPDAAAGSAASEASVADLRVLAHPLRLRLLSLLTGEAYSAAEAARLLDQSQANVSYHLRRHAQGRTRGGGGRGDRAGRHGQALPPRSGQR